MWRSSQKHDSLARNVSLYYPLAYAMRVEVNTSCCADFPLSPPDPAEWTLELCQSSQTGGTSSDSRRDTVYVAGAGSQACGPGGIIQQLGEDGNADEDTDRGLVVCGRAVEARGAYLHVPD